MKLIPLKSSKRAGAMMRDHISMVINLLKPFSDEERKRLADWYYPTAMEVMGVKSPDIKSVISILKKELKPLTDAEKINSVISLARSGVFECQQVAFGTINHNYKLIATLSFDQLTEMGSFMDNWVSTDSFSTMIAGPAWRLGAISDDQVDEWAMSADRWWRRNALVSTVGINLRSQGGEGDAERTLRICRMLLGDKDDMVVKAMSWALRELSKRDSGAVREFMSAYHHLLAARVRKEVHNKLETGRKN